MIDEMYDYSKLPEGLQDGMKLYIEEGIRAGGFLTACLENDLVGAVNKADPDNLPRLQEIVRWIFWEIPHDCWGSPERVARWIGDGGFSGKLKVVSNQPGKEIR